MARIELVRRGLGLALGGDATGGGLRSVPLSFASFSFYGAIILAQVRIDQLLLGGEVARFDALGELERAKLPLDEVMATRDLTRVTSSLDQPIGDDGDTTLGELRAEATADLEEEVLEREQESAVEVALRKLPELEAEVIRGRFGTGGRPAKSIRDVARELGVTQKNAQKLEASALRRLAGDGALAGFRNAA